MQPFLHTSPDAQALEAPWGRDPRRYRPCLQAFLLRGPRAGTISTPVIASYLCRFRPRGKDSCRDAVATLEHPAPEGCPTGKEKGPSRSPGRSAAPKCAAKSQAPRSRTAKSQAPRSGATLEAEPSCQPSKAESPLS